MNRQVDVRQTRFHQAVQARSQGRYRRAVRICRALLKDFGARAEVLSLLGRSLYESGDVEGAIAEFEKLAALTRDKSDLVNLAVLYQKGRRYPQAEAIYHDLLQQAPDAQLWNNLGTVHQAQKQPEKAIEAYRAALALAPDRMDARHNLALALSTVREVPEAIKLLEELLARDPGNIRARFDLAGMMEEISMQSAMDLYREIVAGSPHAPSWVALGRLYSAQERYNEARTSLENALRLAPDSEDALTQRAHLSIQQDELDEAKVFMQRLERRFPDSLNNWRLQVDFSARFGDYQRVLQAIEEVWQQAPDEYYAVGSYLFFLHYAYELTPEAVFDAHRRLGARISKDLGVEIDEPDAPLAAAPRLRVGLVSPDFRNHAVARFLLPVFRHYDREGFEFFCYAENVHRDPVTEELACLADGWRSTVDLSDVELASIIRQDGIEILIDLAGYTNRTRIRAFSLKPAPVQVSWLGYPDTTGLPEMDYRITDAVADPEPGADRFYTEKLVRMKDVFLSYEPVAEVRISEPPCREHGLVTFGSFNSRAKHNESVVALWSEILLAVPESRLLLKDRRYELREAVEALARQFEDHGVQNERLVFLPFVKDNKEHLALYNQVDIALDPFPYNGTTTSCDALWMGVPIVCLYGDRHSARVTASMLRHLGLSELVAEGREAYRECAIALARDPERIRSYKQEIRPRLLRSKLGDGAAFTRDFETVLRQLSVRHRESPP